ncbi:hypothetical protein DE146DRAFT_146564 [Phaeosphaeria sp. MPI-PUGE-AT-0046c]|nr:hypothetical protein DE146DRAFT_146564 [Phaeosphaeria sp. MPI-PUGE-AT-0046c]
MHLPPSLDTSILTSPLYRRSSSHRSLKSTNDLSAPNPTARPTMKSSPPTSPVLRGRSPFKHRAPVSKRRWRAIGRLAMVLLIVFVLGWMGREGVRCGDGAREQGYTCLPSRPAWLTNTYTSQLRDSTGEWVGGGSVIGKLVGQTQREGEQGVMSGMVENEKGDMELIELPEPVHAHVGGNAAVGGGTEENEDESEFIGTMDVPGF